MCDFLHGWLQRGSYRIVYDLTPSATATGEDGAERMSPPTAATFTLARTFSLSNAKNRRELSLLAHTARSTSYTPLTPENFRMSNLSKRVSRFAHRSAKSGIDAAVTIAARTPGLLYPSPQNAVEASRMVEEKVAAACEGAFGATLAWSAFLFASALRGGATPGQWSHAMVDVADAAVAPARRTVSANARRLSKRG